MLEPLAARGVTGKKEANLLRVVAAHECSEKLRSVFEATAEAVTSLETIRESMLVRLGLQTRHAAGLWTH